jgi:hypothetical protein
MLTKKKSVASTRMKATQTALPFSDYWLIVGRCCKQKRQVQVNNVYFQTIGFSRCKPLRCHCRTGTAKENCSCMFSFGALVIKNHTLVANILRFQRAGACFHWKEKTSAPKYR